MAVIIKGLGEPVYDSDIKQIGYSFTGEKIPEFVAASVVRGFSEEAGGLTDEQRDRLISALVKESPERPIRMMFFDTQYAPNEEERAKLEAAYENMYSAIMKMYESFGRLVAVNMQSRPDCVKNFLESLK